VNDMPVKDDPFGLAPLGDNQPPVELGELPSVDEIIAYLEVNYSDVLARAREIVEKGPKYFVIRNDAEDAAANEFLNSVRSNWKNAEAGRLKEKAPYYERDGAIHNWFRTNILDPIALAPANSKERFDPLERTDLGVGPRIMMASTIFKVKKMDAERQAREAELRKAREAEAAAERTRLAAIEAARKAQAEADAAQAAAARKRNADTKAAAEAAAAAAKKASDEAAAAQQAALIAENKAAEERAAAEAAANTKAADLTRIRGGRGGVSSLREILSARDISREELGMMPDQEAKPPGIVALLPYIDDKALEKAARGYADANKATVQNHIRNNTQPIRGVVYYIDHKNAGRA
jgi:hypothetical protein